MLTVDTIPLEEGLGAVSRFRAIFTHAFPSLSPGSYLVSLCPVCLRQRRQNLLNSRRSGVVFLFFVVV